jgi:hypothetical protein
LPSDASDVLKAWMESRDKHPDAALVVDVWLAPTALARYVGSEGAFSAAEVFGVLGGAPSARRACFGLQPEQGAMSIDVEIGNDGRVVDMSLIASTIASEQIETCLLGTIRGLRFPAPKEGPVTLRLPLVLGAPSR